MIALAPQAALAAGVLGALSLGLLRRPPAFALRLTAVLAPSAAIWALSLVPAPAHWPPLVTADGLGLAWQAVMYLAALPLALTLGGEDDAKTALFLGAVLGMGLLATAANLPMLFIGLEFMSLPAYLLVARSRSAPARRLEAALKYFFAGSLAGALFLLGLALWYASTGSFGPTAVLPDAPAQAGLALMAAAALFKVGAVPLHWWLPDAYEASDPEVAGFLSTSMKAAGLLLLMRLCRLTPAAAFTAWLPAAGALTAVVGAALALRQERLRRLLACSSISHAGLLIIGVSAWARQGAGDEGLTPVLFYLAAYAFMSNGAFAFLRVTGLETRAELRGFAARRPALTAAFAVLLFSLAGIPPTGGFFAKLLVFWQALQAGLGWAAVAGAAASLAALGYYLGLIRDAFFEEPAGAAPPGTPGAALVYACAAGALVLGAAPWLLAAWGRTP